MKKEGKRDWREVHREGMVNELHQRDGVVKLLQVAISIEAGVAFGGLGYNMRFAFAAKVIQVSL